MKDTKSPVRKIGVPYLREYVEVQVQNSDTGNWSVKSRNCDTVEQAEKQIADDKKRDLELKWLINLGKFPKCRLVQVKATCVVLKEI